MVRELSVVGKRLPLKDAYQKVTGSLRYAVDFSLSGMLHGKVLRSPYAHARIVKIDTSRAESLPGVAAIITHKDVPQTEWTNPSLNCRRRVLDDRVRFVGDEVAAVAAVDKYIAEEALELIEVEYEELPHVFDIEEAMAPDAPQVSPYGNVRPPSILEWGDIEKGFMEADLVVEHKTTMGTQQNAPIGRNACIAHWENDRLTVWTSTQTLFIIRDELAWLLKMPENKIRVIGLPTGSSFGLWWFWNWQYITVFLAKQARRPVKLELTQEEAFTTVKRRETPITLGKLGVKRDGSFVAMHIKHYFDNGAYGFKNDPFQVIGELWGGRTPHGKLESYGINTNLVTAGCMAGVGNVTMGFSVEQLIDKAARELAMDPVEIRARNHTLAGEQLPRDCKGRDQKARMYAQIGLTPPAITLSSSGLAECLRKGTEAIVWKERWKGWGQPVGVDGARRHGLGMAVAACGCGLNYKGSSSAAVKVNRDGSVHLLTGVARLGTGTDTTQAQIVAEELGIPYDSVTVSAPDTDSSPWCVPSIAGMSAYQIGLAARAAAADAKRQICELASRALEAKPEDLDIEDGTIYVKQLPEKRIPIAEVTAKIMPEFLSPPSIIGRAWKNVPTTPAALILAAHFVEVEVDTETGKVEILRYVAAHDSGQIVNPEICENQVSAGVTMGCGFALLESLVFDQRTGMVLNPNFLDYQIPTALDMPSPEVMFADVADPVGPFGVKGIGEVPHCPPVSAVVQAIHNAIGVAFNSVPVTPDMILNALKGRRK